MSEKIKDTWKLGDHEFYPPVLSWDPANIPWISSGRRWSTPEPRSSPWPCAGPMREAWPISWTTFRKEWPCCPTRSGARNADEAVRIARLAREVCGTDFVKIEVIRDSKYLLPDNYETAKATEDPGQRGLCGHALHVPGSQRGQRYGQRRRRLHHAPWGAPIGSNKGICTKEFIQILIDEIGTCPLSVDAGIGRPSQACEAMEMGAAAVMANTCHRHRRGCARHGGSL